MTGSLIGAEGTYIGVTATPARLDLNHTHMNENEYWVDFPVHDQYVGQDVFFAANLEDRKFKLELLADTIDTPRYLREALFRFLVRVGHRNRVLKAGEQNYSMLIHTSGKREDHSVDFKLVEKLFESLCEPKSKEHEKFFKRIWEIAKILYPGEQDEIARYILQNCHRNNVVVMNSDKEVNAAENRTATSPSAPFTIAIGGNIISRGVTFDNLLSMFFTRDVKHRLQQDTYIQRARMFGSRKGYLEDFELTIPGGLYVDWQRCFIFHRLSLESRRLNHRSPVWLDGQRISVASGASVDRTNVVVDQGEMGFELFEFDPNPIQAVIGDSATGLGKVKELAGLLGSRCLPNYLINFVQGYCPAGDKSVVLHGPKSISGYTDKAGEMDKATIIRKKGFVGENQLETTKYRDAIHHIFIFYNEQGRARVIYKYKGNIRFLKSAKK